MIESGQVRRQLENYEYQRNGGCSLSIALEAIGDNRVCSLKPKEIHKLFSTTRAIIFDVDGTLYDQRKLRFFMLLEMLLCCIRRPRTIDDLRILRDFRRVREKNSYCVDANIEALQFVWGARASRVQVEKVRRIVQEWVFTRPLPHLGVCCYPGIYKVFSVLRERGVPIGVFSDYPAKDRMDFLELKADILVSATDKDVDRLKPDPKGLIVVASKLDKPVKECLFIGDRDDKDGECARRAGMPYFILNQRRGIRSDGLNSFFEIAEWYEKNVN